MNESDNDGKGYVLKTLRSTAVVAVLVALTLASYGLNALIAPFMSGVLLGAVLLWGLDKFVRGVFAPEKVRARKKSGTDGRWALLAFALIKYPLVGVLLWLVVRAWGHETARIMAFAGGFILLQVIIALRAVGKAITTSGSKY